MSPEVVLSPYWSRCHSDWMVERALGNFGWSREMAKTSFWLVERLFPLVILCVASSRVA